MNQKDINRRTFIELSVGGTLSMGAVSLLSDCANKSPLKMVNGACYHDCPDGCSWKVTVENNKVSRFEAHTDNPYVNGTLCDKMDRFPDEVAYNPNRLLRPLKRIGEKGEGKFEPISWDIALKEVSGRLKTIIDEKGGEAVLPFSYGGNEGLVQGRSISNRFFARLGASQLERTICGDAAVAGVTATNGQSTGIMPADIVHSRYIILWGTNPVISNQHLWPLIQKARADGAKLVVIDPFVSQTAKEADLHLQPYPGTDTALALGLIHVIQTENLQDSDYIEKYTSGIAELTAHVQKFTPEYVAGLTGLSSENITTLARAYASGDPSLIRFLIGLEHQANGASAFRAISMLPALTGAWRKQGGGLLHMTYELFGNAINWEHIELPPELSSITTRTINMIQLGKALTSKELNPSIDALFVFNANPAVTIPNQNAVLEGLKRDDLLTVVLDHFMTDTARFADYIFPATTVLENWDVYTSWGTPYINLNEPAIEPLGEAKPNTEFFRLLAKAMGYEESYLQVSDLDIVKRALETDHPYMKGIDFKSLRKTGWARLTIPDLWLPHAEGNFNTSDGKCMLYNPEIEPALPDYQPVLYSEEDNANYPYHLLTIKSTRNFLNSSHGNIGRLIENEGPPVLDISKEDAERAAITDGEMVKVYNQRGEVTLQARIRSRVRPGVLCMPQGYWPSLQEGGSSANALTDDLLTDMGRGGAIQEARVGLMKMEAT